MDKNKGNVSHYPYLFYEKNIIILKFRMLHFSLNEEKHLINSKEIERISIILFHAFGFYFY